MYVSHLNGIVTLQILAKVVNQLTVDGPNMELGAIVPNLVEVELSTATELAPNLSRTPVAQPALGTPVKCRNATSIFVPAT